MMKETFAKMAPSLMSDSGPYLRYAQANDERLMYVWLAIMMKIRIERHAAWQVLKYH
jgi:hypothetical protein